MDKDVCKNTKRGLKPKDWRYAGEVDAKNRPINSLLPQTGVEYERAESFSKLSTKEDAKILKLLKQRIREQSFENFDYGAFCQEKEPVYKTEVEEYKDVGRDEVEKLFLDVKAELDSLANIGGVWCNTSIEVYRERPAEVLKKKEDKKMHRRDKASMRVLKKAKNVKILK